MGWRIRPWITGNRTRPLLGMGTEWKTIAGQCIAETLDAQIGSSPLQAVGGGRITPAIEVALEAVCDIPQAKLPRCGVLHQATSKKIRPNAFPGLGPAHDRIVRMFCSGEESLGQM